MGKLYDLFYFVLCRSYVISRIKKFNGFIIFKMCDDAFLKMYNELKCYIFVTVVIWQRYKIYFFDLANKEMQQCDVKAEMY